MSDYGATRSAAARVTDRHSRMLRNLEDKTMMTIIDPPSGWKYGFPKPLPDEVEDVLEWLVSEGYPQSEIDKLGKHFYCRYWETEDE